MKITGSFIIAALGATSALAGLLPDEQLNLTPEHFENARRLYKEQHSLQTQADFAGKFKVGDTVRLGLPTFYSKSDGHTFKDFIEGKVQKLIVDNEAIVGLVIQRPTDTSASPRRTPSPDTVWLSDVDPEEIHILKKSAKKTRRPGIQAAEIPEPETSFPITFHFGNTQMVPVAVGDGVCFRFKEKNGAIILVAGRGASEGRTIEAIVRDASGNPVGLKYKYVPGDINDSIYSYDKNRIDADGLVTVYFSEILRADSIPPRIETSSPKYDWFRMPKSRLRFASALPGYAWLPGIGSGIRVNDDSGEFMLKTGRGSMFGDTVNADQAYECPVSPGDELSVSRKKPGTLLGFSYDRVLVLEILKDSEGKTYGFRTEKLGSGDPTSVLNLADLNRDDSYIEMNPFGARSGKTPGAWDKRRPYTPEVEHGHREDLSDPAKIEELFKMLFKDTPEVLHAGLFGEKSAHSPRQPKQRAKARGPIAPWTTAPIGFEQWAEKFGRDQDGGTQREWAMWVLQIDSAHEDKVRKASQKLYIRFHPDRKTECSELLSEIDDRKVVSAIIGRATITLL